MGACLGRNNNITIKDSRNRFDDNDSDNVNHNDERILKGQKYISSNSLNLLGSHFQEFNKNKNNNTSLYPGNNPNNLDITNVISDYSIIDNNNNTTFKEILELFN